MCTLAVYVRLFENYPLIIAANRDEHFSRPSAPPRILANDTRMIAGRDLVAGGTWLGVNECGLAAGIVNRAAKPAIAGDPRSRGSLCLDVAKSRDADYARNLLARENAARYQPFVLVVASAAASFVAYNVEREIRMVALGAGIHVFGNRSFSGDDRGKLKRAQELFSGSGESLRTVLQGPVGNLESAVTVLRKILSDHAPADDSLEAKDAICVHTAHRDYGTVSSSIIFQSHRENRWYFYHASGAPCRAEFDPIEPLPIL